MTDDADKDGEYWTATARFHSFDSKKDAERFLYHLKEAVARIGWADVLTTRGQVHQHVVPRPHTQETDECR